MLQVRLNPGLPGGRWAYIRPLRGHDEQLVGAGATAATELLDRLLVEEPDTTVGPGRAFDLAICDRDRLLAAVYAASFGDRIESEIPCLQCDEGAEVNFSLSALVASLEVDDAARAEVGVRHGPDHDGVYQLDDGTRFRLPTGVDQRAVFGQPPGQARVALLRRCLLGDDRDGRTVSDLDEQTLARVEAAMERVGPTVDHTFSVGCQECGAEREVRFDIQHFLLRALDHERRYLVREIHYLAATYGWGLEPILGLSRDDRRAFVRLIVADRGARHRSA
ncbi:MAG TPA: hypothetical protein VK034_02260 [Enhygromyxa sp.]|nr:hypothetical protein [Enhygromyxa sp.]